MNIMAQQVLAWIVISTFVVLILFPVMGMFNGKGGYFNAIKWGALVTLFFLCLAGLIWYFIAILKWAFLIII